MRFVLTAQAAAISLALREAGDPKVLRRLTPECALAEGITPPGSPVFLRHICPAEVEVALTGGARDIPALVQAMEPLVKRLDKNKSFSIQTRILEGFQPAYKRFDVNTALCDAAAQTGALPDVRAPEQIVSVTLYEGTGWLGLSTPEANISDWAGGARRLKREEAQISRAEFKLLEALEVFRVPLPEGGHALDLGAAPGGWTRALRQRGLSVTAVDPAELDARVLSDGHVTHFKGTAQAYFKDPGPCDIMVNDMKMDTGESAKLMVEGARCLTPGGAAVMTLKLPGNPKEWPGRISAAKAVLEKAYRVEGMRQLFHNRSEVTAYLVRRPMR